MTNAGRLFFYAGDRVDYVIVHNPAKARGDLFKGSQLEKQLMEYGAKSVTLPAVTPTTLLAIEKAEAIAKRGLSFAELSHVEAGHIWNGCWLVKSNGRCRRCSGNTTPSRICCSRLSLIPKEKSAPRRKKRKDRAQPQLNFGE
jgi:hypothetical protein